MKTNRFNDSMELLRFVKNYYGYKIQRAYIGKDNDIRGLLYGAFMLSCNINDRYGRFGACIDMGTYVIADFLGNICSLDNTEQDVIMSLKYIDDYCRMRLPDKYLDAYEKAYKKE